MSLASYLPALARRSIGTETARPLAESGFAAVLFTDLIGFTARAESLSALGPRGAEELSRIVDAHFGQLTAMVLEAGGDVLAFAGDAALVAWPADGEAALAAATSRAAQCGLRLQETVSRRSSTSLTMRASIGAGAFTHFRLGGEQGRWLFLAAGEAVAAATAADALARAGDVVLAPRAAALLGRAAQGSPLEGGALRLQAVEAVKTSAPVETVEAADAALRALVPEMIVARIDAGLKALIGEFRRVTTVFCGLGGLEMDRPDALERLHAVVRAVQAEVARLEGTVYQLLTDDKGTTLVAAFGLPPRSHEDDAARGTLAALAMHGVVTRLGLNPSVGVATGLLYCGVYGTVQRRQYAVAGPAINLAARLMQQADGAVLSDDETRRRTGGRHGLRFAAMPLLHVKGRADALAVYQPAIGAPQAEPLDEPTRAGPLVGRASECARICSALDAAKAGRGGVVFIEGEPGIGKSRLVVFARSGAASRGLRTIAGAGSDIEKTAAYHAWRPVLRALAGRDPALVAQRLGLATAQEAPLPLLGPLIGLDLGVSQLVAELTDEVKADNLRALMLAALAHAGSSSPTVVLLEDAQWFDSPSLALLIAAARNVPAMLFVVTSRLREDPPADHAALAGLAGAAYLKLQALDPDAVDQLLADRLGARTVPEPVRALVRDRAAGNPFYSEELGYALRDFGLLVVEQQQCRIANPARELAADFTEALASRGLPATVQGVVTSRIDRLDLAEQFVVRVASVIGRSFSVAMLGEIHPEGVMAAALDRSLVVLTEREILRPEPDNDGPRYTFRHAITQQVAYDLTPFAQRRDLHRAVGEWLEVRHAADLAPVLPLLALHWRRAEVVPKAVDYLGRAGEQAFQGFANAEAVGLLRDALELGRDVPAATRVRWEMQAGRACVNWSRYPDGARHLESGLTLSGERVPHGALVAGGLIAQLLRQVAHRRLPHWFVGRRSASRDTLLAQARAHEALVEVHYLQDASLPCLYAALRGLNVAELAGRSPELARGYATVGAIAGFVPLPRVADAYCRRALDTARAVGDLPAEIWASLTVATYKVGAAAWDEAQALLDFVLAESQRLGDSRRWEDGAQNMAAAHYLQGRFEESLSLATGLLNSGIRRNDSRAQTSALQRSILCLLALGRDDVAAARYEEITALRWEGGTMQRELPLCTLRALTAERKGDRQVALAAALEGAAFLAKLMPAFHENLIDAAGVTDVLLRELDDRPGGIGRRDDVARALKAALGALRRVARVFPIARPWLAVHEGRAERLRGREGRALRRWRDAIAFSEALGMPDPGVLARRLTSGRP